MKLEPYPYEDHTPSSREPNPTLTVNGENVELTEEQRRAFRESVRSQVSLSRHDQMALSHQFKIRAHRAALFAKMQNGINPERITQLLKAARCYEETARQLEKLARTPFIDGK